VFVEKEPCEFVPPELLRSVEITGGEEDCSRYVGRREARLAGEEVVRVSVVKGQSYRMRGQGTVLETPHEVHECQGMTSAAKNFELLLKTGGGHGEAPGVDCLVCDAMIHKDHWLRLGRLHVAHDPGNCATKPHVSLVFMARVIMVTDAGCWVASSCS